MRRQLALNHEWTFIPDFRSEFLNSKHIDEAVIVSIPHTMKEIPFSSFDEEDYQFIGTYSKIISIDESMMNHTLKINFGAVMNIAKVYVNGILLLIHEGGYVPFTVDITSSVKPGENLLQVVVDSTEIAGVPPFGHIVDYLGYGGIYREVTLMVLPLIHIDSIHVSTDEAASMHEDEMLVSIDLKLENKDLKELQVKATIIKEGNPEFSSIFENKITDSIVYSSTMKGITRWSVDNPKLYELQIELIDKDEVIDSKTVRFGFRTVSFSPEGFFLNNKHLKLIGLNRHQSYPYVGYAMPKSMQRLDADILKEYGCNIVRTSHYMQSDHFIDRCDEIGLLVLEEIPGWQFIGDEHFKELTYQNLETMINHHYNHPSIISWGVRINESADDKEFYEKTNDIARSLDLTRQTHGVRNTKKGEFLEDIYSYNDFSHNGYNAGLENPNKITQGYVPYIVTEHNGHVYPVKKYDHESKRVDQAMRHASVIDSAYEYKRISGAIGWCLADYNTHIQFGSNDRVCHHGVMDMFRIPKYAAYTYKSQLDDKPFVKFLSDIIPGDHPEFRLPEIAVMTNCEYIKLFKNDQLVGEYYPDWESFPNMPHPPIIIDDLIGNLLIENEKFKPKLAKKITRLLVSFNLNGFDMPLGDKILFGWLSLTKKLKMEDIMYLFEKYLSMQSEAPVTFRAEGYIEEEMVAKDTRGHSKKTEFKAEINSNLMIHGDTYDVARITVSLVDQHQNVITYATEGFKIETTDNLAIIGPDHASLSAGSFGFYVKTTGKPGKAKIKVIPDHHPEITIPIEIN